MFIYVSTTSSGEVSLSFMNIRVGNNGVTVTEFFQSLFISDLYLELSYFLSQVLGTVTRVSKVPKFLVSK